MRTENAIERLNCEIFLLTRAGGAFPDGKSVLILVIVRLKRVVESE